MKKVHIFNVAFDLLSALTDIILSKREMLIISDRDYGISCRKCKQFAIFLSGSVSH